MSANELRKKIEQHQNSIQARRDALCTIRQQIIEEAKPFIKTELQRIVDKGVIEDSAHTKELNQEKLLSSMKQQLSDLLNRSDSLVEEIFSDDALWTYVNINTSEDDYTLNDSRNAMEKVKNGIKMALGEAGKLFQEFGYAMARTMYKQKNGSRRDFNLVNDNQPQDKLYYEGYVQLLRQFLSTPLKYTPTGQLNTPHNIESPLSLPK